MAEAQRIIGAMPSMNASRIGAGPAEVLDALQLLLQVEYLLAALYTRTTSATGLVPTTDAVVFSTLDTQTAQHQGRISVAITTRAGIVPPTPVFDFTVKGAFPGFAFAAGQYTTLQMLAQIVEDLAVRAYLGQLAALATDKPALNTALTILTVKGRHASEVRRLRAVKAWITGNSRDDLPAFAQAVYDGEENVTQGTVNVSTVAAGFGEVAAATQAFDEPLAKAQVAAILALFVA